MEASTRTLTLALVVLAAAISVVVKADDGRICGVTRAELMQCKPYAATGPTVPPPPPKTGACCTAVKHADLACFCGLRNHPSLPFLGISAARAMQLPHLCDPANPQHCS